MALEEHDREDLLRDGQAMPVRGELTLGDKTVFIGFRNQGQASLYFGADQVFQFDTDAKLRRVFLMGRKYAADSGTLKELRRQSRGGRVELVPEPADESTTAAILDAVAESIRVLSLAISDQAQPWRVVGADSAVFRGQVTRWLQSIPSPLQIGAAPGA